MQITIPANKGAPDFSSFSLHPKAWTNARYHGDGTVTVEVTDPAWPPITKKSDIWHRATDDEIDAIDAVLADPPEVEGMSAKKIVRIWNDTQEIRHTDNIYAVIHQVATELFGKERADELLAPSDT